MMKRALLALFLIGCYGSCITSAAQVGTFSDRDLAAGRASAGRGQPAPFPDIDPWSPKLRNNDGIQLSGNQNSTKLARSSQDSNSDRKAMISVSQLKLSGKTRDALHKAWVALSKDKLGDAARYVEKALALSPQSAVALTFRASLETLDLNTMDKARADAEKAIEYDPNYGVAYLILGSVYNTHRQTDDAIRTLERGITLTPTSWQGYYEMSIALVNKGDFAGGLRQAEKALRLKPEDYANLHLVKAYSYMGLKNEAAATSELDIFRTLDPDSPVLREAQETFDKVSAIRNAHTDGRP